MTGLHIIIGEDDFLVGEAAKRLIAGGEGLEVIDSARSANETAQLADLREADLSFSTPPFLEPRKVTWWKNVHFLPQSGKGGPAEAVKAALEKFARRLAAAKMPENQCFILSGPKLLSTSVFAKTLKATAEMIVFSAGKPWEAARAAVARVQEFAAGLELSFEPGVAEAFVARVGVDSRSLMNELEKLRAYLGPDRQRITPADVNDITSQGIGVEPEVWAISDAIGARNPSAALAAADAFAGESGFAVLVTTVAEKAFRQLLELKDAQEKGRLAEAGEKMNQFALKKQTAFLQNWELRELRLARYRFLTLREKVVSSSSGALDVLVLTELVRTLRRPPRRV